MKEVSDGKQSNVNNTRGPSQRKITGAGVDFFFNNSTPISVTA